MLENEYYYEFKYVYKDKVVTMKFSGEVDFNQLLDNLKAFLASAEWSESTIKEHIKTDTDMFEEAEQKQKEEVKPEYNYNITYTDNNYDDNNDFYQKSYDEDYIDG